MFTYFIYQIFHWGLPVAWFLAIWLPEYRVELIMTGLLCMIFEYWIGQLIFMEDEDEEMS